jgi:adenylate cyclase
LIPAGRPLRWVLPAVLLLALVLLQWLVPGWAGRVEGWTVDQRFRLRGAESPHSNIVIVALDEDSFQLMGDLQGENIRTWPRARWAELVDKIDGADPRLIALDIVFDTPGWDPGGDQALVQVLAAAGNVALPAHLERTAGDAYENVTYSPPIGALSQAAAAVGVANLIPDSDGTIRRGQLLWPWEGQTAPSFALVVATLSAGAPIKVDRADLGDDLAVAINYRGPEATFPTISMYDLWSGEPSPEVLRDAIVLVGYTTQLEQDRHPAPFAGTGKLPGVEVQANLVDTLLAGDWLDRPPDWLPIVLVAAAGLFALAALSLPRPGVGLGVVAGLVILYLALGQALFAWSDYLLPLTAPVAAAVAVGGTAQLERLIFAERDKRRLRQRFSGLMSPERLHSLMENWETLLDVERPEKDAAVLFADIRGFTHTTETLMRQGRSPDMVRFLNAYVDAMAEGIILEGGVIYRTMGDGLLVMFGMPEPLPDFALRAVRAAVRMAVATRGLQDVWPLPEEMPLEVGIGVHCGPLVDTIMGRGQRFDYTVLGDAVNTAARIESHCKVAMEIPRPAGGQVPEEVTILISRDLYEQVREHVLADEGIPPFSARGKGAPVQVVRVLGMKGEL